MKKLTSLFLALLLLLGLLGCQQKMTDATTTANVTPVPTTTAGCKHVYADADCTNPKKCILCGNIRGNALGHDYQNGTCARCNETDASYVALVDGNWRMDALSPDGSHLEYIILTFAEDGTAQLQVYVYGRLSDISEDLWDQYESSLYDYSGELYYPTGVSYKRTLQYTADDRMITCTITANGEVTATLLLERNAGSRLSITFYEGDLPVEYPQIGDMFSCMYT